MSICKWNNHWWTAGLWVSTMHALDTRPGNQQTLNDCHKTFSQVIECRVILEINRLWSPNGHPCLSIRLLMATITCRNWLSIFGLVREWPDSSQDNAGYGHCSRQTGSELAGAAGESKCKTEICCIMMLLLSDRCFPNESTRTIFFIGEKISRYKSWYQKR